MDVKRAKRIPRILIAKIGLDGHSRGVYVVAHGLRQAGMEVIYTGLRQTPGAVARTALQEDVDLIGISSMVGAHLTVVKKLKKELENSNASDIPIIIGGIIPEADHKPLHALGVNRVFPPGAEVKEMVRYIHSLLEGPNWIPEIPGSLTGGSIEDLHLLGSQCESCGYVYFPSRKNCPRCPDSSIRNIPLSDKGRLHSYVISTVAPPGYGVPHAQGYVDLDENGPRIFSLLIDYGDGTKLKPRCRMKLKIVKRETDPDKGMIMGYRFRPQNELDSS